MVRLLALLFIVVLLHQGIATAHECRLPLSEHQTSSKQTEKNIPPSDEEARAALERSPRRYQVRRESVSSSCLDCLS
jgi:hypothetical protein